MTAITSTQIQVEVSQPRRSPLTVADKAKAYGPIILWTRVEGDPFSLIMESPNSGKLYRVSLDITTGRTHCSCPCKSICYHIVSFDQEFKPALMAAYRPNRYSVAPVSRPVISEAQRNADWN